MKRFFVIIRFSTMLLGGLLGAIATIATVASVATAAAQSRETEGATFRSTLLKADIAYSVVLPSDYYTSGKSYPVVYMLHGVGDNASSWLEYGRIAQIADSMVAAGEIAPFIAVMPQGDRDYYSNFWDGSYPYQDMFTREFVPLIDSLFRTIPDAGSRAVMGYSMGGFGALALPLKHPDMFSVILSLSASIRTDGQYKAAPQQEWDDQWGRIFGGTGKSGDARITDYYKRNSPLHLITNMDKALLDKLHIFVDNGDEEGTLCRSNEELHMLLNSRKIAHTYRIRDGGHSFDFWRRATPDALRFADCAFLGRKYEPIVKLSNPVPECALIEQSVAGCTLYLPQETETHRRLYPTIYVTGNADRADLMRRYRSALAKADYSPVAFCFVPSAAISKLTSAIIPQIEKAAPVRAERRFRALWITHGDATAALETAATSEQFKIVIATDADFTLSDSRAKALAENLKKAKSRPALWIDVTSQSDFYNGNSFLHSALREADIAHEFRARDYTTLSLWDSARQALTFTNDKFHY